MNKLLFSIMLLAFSASSHATQTVTNFDGGGKTFGTSCVKGEGQEPVFLVKDGGTLKNVVIKAGGGADGVHCEGNCTLQNVQWPDVCEDAATMKGGSGKTMNVVGGSAAKAEDKVFQHNGKGSTVKISGFTTTGSIGKLYRSCGNCSNNGGPRFVNISNTKIEKTGSVVGVNSNFGDKATIRSLQIKGYKAGSPKVCVTYKGVQSGSSSPKIGEEWNTSACNVSKSDVKAF